MSDAEALQAIHTALRRRCGPSLYAQGARLGRECPVRIVRESDDEISLAVHVPGWATPPTVVLYLESEEWACDCGGSDPCLHVAAALVALDDARKRGEALAPAEPSESTLSKVGYRLERAGGGLAIARVLVAPDGAERPLEGSLLGVSAETTEADLALDRMLDVRGPLAFAPASVGELFSVLARCQDLRLDGRAVQASDEPLFPRAIVDDHPAGFVLRIERDPALSELVAPGIARCGDTLRPLAAMDLSGERLEKLPATRVFPAAQVADLVAEVMPALSSRLPIEVRSKRLPPRVSGLRPRVLMDLSQEGHTLAVTPMLVYGDPPMVRVEGGRLVHLSGGVPLRDEAEETRLAQQLRDELNLALGRRVEFEGSEALRFASRLKTWSQGTGATSAIFGTRPLAPRIEVREGGAFDLSFEAPREDMEGNDDAPPRRATADAVIRAWQEGLDLVPLEGGGWAPLPLDWLEKHGHRVADLLAARDDQTGCVPRAVLPALAQLCEHLEAPLPPDFARLEPLVRGFESIPEASLPADLCAKLRPYQRRGVDWLCFIRDAGLGAVLADDMGLGKTLQALCALRGRALVVCPTSVVHNWIDEIRRFRPGLRVSVYHGASRTLDASADVTITTYAVLRLDADTLARERWDAVVLDEAQAIKNPDSQVARAAYGLQADFRLALSGTPVENRLEELWSLFHFVNRGLLGGRSDFDERYARPIVNGDARAAERLRARVRPFVLRRLKREVAPELPPRTDAVLHCELDEHERAVYDAVRVATRREVIKALESGGGTLAALEALLRLRQAACHAALVPGQYAQTSSKIERLLEALEEARAEGHKALVFSQWTSLLDRVEPHLRARGLRFVRLDGSTRDRASVVAEFQTEAGPPLMLVSLKAGGTGLNLTAADHVFLLDPWWNPAVEDQAADRAHRIGQQRPVTVYRMVAKDTVEERILALQERKRALASAALDDAGGALAITRDELLALLE